MWATARPTCSTSIVGSAAIEPSACGTPWVIRAASSVCGVADVDLPAGDVVRAPLERQRPREAGDRVLRGRVGDRVRPRHVRGERPVVDDPPAARLLGRHRTERRLRAQERAGQVRVHDPLPVLVVDLVIGTRKPDAGVVEQQVDAPVALQRRGEQRRDRRRVGDVGGHDEPVAVARASRGAAPRAGPPATTPSRLRAALVRRPGRSRARPGYDRDHGARSKGSAPQIRTILLM